MRPTSSAAAHLPANLDVLGRRKFAPFAQFDPPPRWAGHYMFCPHCAVGGRMTRRERLALQALRNRQELLAAGLTRRDLAKLGLLGGSGYLVVRSGLSF